MLRWVNGIVRGQNDLALILGDDKNNRFDLVKCVDESNGLQTVDGFSCIFESLPHVCVFNTKEVGTFHVFDIPSHNRKNISEKLESGGLLLVLVQLAHNEYC